jgi:hypothetical protein
MVETLTVSVASGRKGMSNGAVRCCSVAARSSLRAFPCGHTRAHLCLCSWVEAAARAEWATSTSPRVSATPTGVGGGSMGEVGLCLAGTSVLGANPSQVRVWPDKVEGLTRVGTRVGGANLGRVRVVTR